jgi:hypothetical protein
MGFSPNYALLVTDYVLWPKEWIIYEHKTAYINRR